jgi:energy-coupling factor transporter ATP-binding protein EcfA2
MLSFVALLLENNPSPGANNNEAWIAVLSLAKLLCLGFALGAVYARARVIGQIESGMFALDTREKIISSIDDSRLRDVNVAHRTQAERNEIRLKNNLSAIWTVKSFELHKAGIFSDASWNLEPGVNVLLGRNGFGKTLLLRLLVGMLSYDDDRLGTMLSKPDAEQRLAVSLLRNGEDAAIERDQKTFVESVGKIPLLAIPDSRFINRTREGVSAEGDNKADPARDGAHHFLYEEPFEARLQTVLTQMCIEYINSRSRNASLHENLQRMERGAGKTPRLSTPQLDLVSNVMQELSGERFSFVRIEPIGSARFTIEIESDSSPGRPISIQHASQGTLSVVAIFGLIYQFLRAVFPSAPEEEICKKPAIVIVDEVDAHLHPAWQRRIVVLLRKHFPNVQFILTAHSPLVVAGCGGGEVALLHREDAGLRIVDFQRDFVGVPPEEIYRKVFEIEDRDVRFLELQAQLPNLPELIRELEVKKSQKSGANDATELEKRIESIKRTDEEQKTKLGYESLQQENEQLRRQLEAAQRKLAGTTSA